MVQAYENSKNYVLRSSLQCKLLDVLERRCNCEEHYLWDTRVWIFLFAGFFPHGRVIESQVFLSNMVNRMDRSFVYYFLVFGACIQGYAHIRKVIVVDDTHLYGKYGGILLSAIAQDTENHIFLIAFYVVDKENDASWTIFFLKLKSIVKDEPDLCVISDRHFSIANAFSRVYSCVHHGLCMRNLAENLCVNQHYREHLYLFYATVKAYSFEEFSDNFLELKSNCPEAAHVLKNILGFKNGVEHTFRAIGMT